MTFRLLTIGLLLGIGLAALWLLAELRADKRDRSDYDVPDMRERLPPRGDL